MSNSGYFDWFPLETHEPYLSADVTISIDFSQVTTRTRNALRKAINSGMLASYGGVVAAMYRTISTHHQWCEPHLWSKSSYVGCKFFVTEDQWNAHIAPYLAVLAPNNVALSYKQMPSTNRSNYGTLETIRHSEGRGWSPRSNALVNKTPPDILYTQVKMLDTRDRTTVDAVLDAIDSGDTFSASKHIS